jgi:hypothetical protein
LDKDLSVSVLHLVCPFNIQCSVLEPRLLSFFQRIGFPREWLFADELRPAFDLVVDIPFFEAFEVERG